MYTSLILSLFSYFLDQQAFVSWGVGCIHSEAIGSEDIVRVKLPLHLNQPIILLSTKCSIRPYHCTEGTKVLKLLILNDI